MCLLFYSSPVVFVFSNTHSQKDHQISVGDLNTSCTQFEISSLDSVKHSTANVNTCLESRTNKPTRRSRKTDSDEICLNSKWITVTDVDHIHVTEEKRKQMMKKARAISRAISEKAANSKNSIPAAPNLEQSHVVCVSASESVSQNDNVQSAMKTDVKSNDGAKFGWRIPRVQKVQTITAFAGNPPSSSKVAPPLSKQASSSFGWHTRGQKTVHAKEFGGEMLHRPFISRQMLDDNMMKVPPLTLTLTQSAASSQRAKPDVVEEKIADGLKVAGTSELPTEMSQTTAGKLLCCDSSSKLLSVPQHEAVEKLQSSSIQKSTLLLPDTVPAHGDRGMAVSILVPSQNNLNLNQSTAQPESTAKISSTQHTAPVLVVNASILSSPYNLTQQSPAAKKRKLNISQYKSILPQRQKMMPQSAPAAVPTVRVYGHCEDILHDHDYVTGVKGGRECIKKPSVEQSSVSLRNVIGTEVATVTDGISDVTTTAPATTEAMQDGTKRDTEPAAESVTENVSGNATSHVISSPIKPAAPSLSAAFEIHPESASKVTVSKIDAMASSVDHETVDCMPAYFDVVSLPNQQTKISVSAATLVTKKKISPQSCVIVGDPDSAKALSNEPSDKPLSEPDVDHDVESHVSVSPQLDSEKMIAIKDHFSSRSSSASSAISVSSDEESSRSRSRSSCRYCSTCESSYSSDSRSEKLLLSCFVYGCLMA